MPAIAPAADRSSITQPPPCHPAPGNRFWRAVTLGSVLWLAFAIAGCAQKAVETGAPQNSAEAQYRKAKARLDNGDYFGAVDAFETLEALFPFGEYTQQAQLNVAYAYLKQSEFDNAIAAADRYIKLYPTSDDIDYAWFIKGLANYSRGSSIFEKLVPRDMARVDQAWLRNSYADFDTLVKRYPDSRYAEDASARMRYLYDQMARHELLAARYYRQRGALVAAINRARYLLSHYESSVHAPAALALMAEAYGKLGQHTEQQDTLRVLALNDPDHPALEALDNENQ